MDWTSISLYGHHKDQWCQAGAAQGPTYSTYCATVTSDPRPQLWPLCGPGASLSIVWSYYIVSSRWLLLWMEGEEVWIDWSWLVLCRKQWTPPPAVSYITLTWSLLYFRRTEHIFHFPSTFTVTKELHWTSSTCSLTPTQGPAHPI